MKGILFTQENIKAIRDLRKDVTRRLDNLKEINQEPDKWCIGRPEGVYTFLDTKDLSNTRVIRPRYKVGEVVYIKEAHLIFRKDTEEEANTRFMAGQNIKSINDLIKWSELPTGHGEMGILYKSDFGEWADNPDSDLKPWRSPLFLPEKFARSFLKILSVRPERLQEIEKTHEDYKKEGYIPLMIENEQGIPIERSIDFAWYEFLWDEINPKYPYKLNPWCWRIEFKLLDKDFPKV